MKLLLKLLIAFVIALFVAYVVGRILVHYQGDPFYGWLAGVIAFIAYIVYGPYPPGTAV